MPRQVPVLTEPFEIVLTSHLPGYAPSASAVGACIFEYAELSRVVVCSDPVQRQQAEQAWSEWMCNGGTHIHVCRRAHTCAGGGQAHLPALDRQQPGAANHEERQRRRTGFASSMSSPSSHT